MSKACIIGIGIHPFGRTEGMTGLDMGVAALRTALEGTDVEAIKAKTNDLMQASMKLGEAMYAASQAEGAPEGADAAHGAEKKDDVIDAEYEVKE